MRSLGWVLAAVQLVTGGPSPAPPSEPDATLRASAAVHRWEAAREAAFRAGDPARLRAVYTTSAAGPAAHDVAVLAAYRRQEVRITAVRGQLLAMRVRQADAGRVRVDVLERVVWATAAAGRCVVVRGRPELRGLVLRRSVRGWQVAAVRPVRG